MTQRIAAELYRTLLLLGADHQLLGTVASWSEGADENEVLSNLEAWNSGTAQELKARTQSYEESCSYQAYSRGADRKTA
jgi:hypothetical protein